MPLQITDTELTQKLAALCQKEREATLTFLLHLIEFDSRRLFREQGYSSLFDYLTRKLRYSEGSAQRRILGARCMRDNPELEKLFLEGKVTLCSIATAAGSIRRETTKVEEIVGKSKREVETLVAVKEPKAPAMKESVRPVAVISDSKSAGASLALPLDQRDPSAFLQEPKSPPPLMEERYEVRFSLTKDEYKNFEEVRNLLSNSLGQGAAVAAVFNKLVDRFLKPYHRAAKLKSSEGRYIPASLKQEVYRRDHGECSYQAPDGTKCTEKAHLQYDHIVPFALGGKTELENLRLTCAAHNRLYAEQFFGDWKGSRV